MRKIVERDDIEILENKIDIMFHKLNRKIKDIKVLNNLYYDMYELFISQQYELLNEHFWFFCRISEYYFPNDEKMYYIFSKFEELLLDERLLKK